LTVSLEEEYGYRHWFWYPKMSEKELLDWWKKLESIDPYFMSPEPLPGKVIQTDDLDKWMDLDKSKQYYYAHTHCDDDSVLISPRGIKHYHKGYIGEK